MRYCCCDRCGRRIDPAQEVHYVVQVAVQAEWAVSAMREAEEDRDYLTEIHESLEGLSDDEAEAISADVSQARSYDLCAKCCNRYSADPLGVESAAAIRFSRN